MPAYTVNVFTHRSIFHVLKSLSVRLIGKNAASDWTWFTGLRSVVCCGETTLTVRCPEDLGDLIYIELQKKQPPLTFESQWYVYKVEVTSSDGNVFKFPIYHWLKRTKVYTFCEGTALRPFEEEKPPCPIAYPRRTDLGRRAQKYWWTEYKKDLPQRMIGEGLFNLPSEVQFSCRKTKDFLISAAPQQVKSRLYRLLEAVDCLGCFTWKKPWKSFDDIYRALRAHIPKEEGRVSVAEYVQQHWREDAFFGYLCLNGVNPIKIQRCACLPCSFPVTDEMVPLEGNVKLSDEMKKGNIFICDYGTLDGVETGSKGEEPEYLAAPLVLLHKTPNDEMKPVAIQLRQTGPEKNLIFLHTDSEYDWLLAKTYVRGAEFSEHQLNTHLLRTHLLSEVYAVSLLRNTPKVHPLHKLLVPHTRYTLHINQLARSLLINETGIFPTFSATTEKGMITVLQRSLEKVTYKSLCIKDDIEDRGMESVPNYFYRDDGVKLWDVIERFVDGVLRHYYKTDEEIRKDHELQNYIKDIFEYGFLSRETSGIPQRFESVAELVKFATMVIFTASAQHSAVNNGQYKYGGWMPNTPTTLTRPPPSAKGATEQTLLTSLPEYKVAENAASVLKLLSTQSADFRRLGDFPDEHFTEMVPRLLMKRFSDELKELNEEIDGRNKNLDLPYEYLKPELMENSVSI